MSCIHACMLSLISILNNSNPKLVVRRLASHARELLARQISATDAAIDRRVYELYDLTPEEIALVEAGA
jgi:hypothetical protein